MAEVAAMAEGTGGGEIVADFVQTMKDWRRMCQHMEKIGDGRSCDICPLGGCNAIYEEDGSTDYANVEEKVAAWAAEHPEPKYPTWQEWLHDLGLIVQKDGTFTEYMSNGIFSTTKKVDALTIKGYQSIPADIAQKLGIEPKEG